MQINIDEIKVLDRIKDIRSNEYLYSLAEDIKTNGLKNPIKIDDNNVLITGFQRLQAISMYTDIKTIEVSVISNLSELEKLNMEFEENYDNESLTIGELMKYAFKRSALENITKTAIAKVIGTNSSTFYQTEKIYKNKSSIDIEDYCKWYKGEMTTNAVFTKYFKNTKNTDIDLDLKVIKLKGANSIIAKADLQEQLEDKEETIQKLKELNNLLKQQNNELLKQLHETLKDLQEQLEDKEETIQKLKERNNLLKQQNNELLKQLHETLKVIDKLKI